MPETCDPAGEAARRELEMEGALRSEPTPDRPERLESSDAAIDPAAEDLFERMERAGVGGAAMHGTDAELPHSEPPEAAEPAVSNGRAGGVGARGAPGRSRWLRGVGARMAAAGGGGALDAPGPRA